MLIRVGMHNYVRTYVCYFNLYMEKNNTMNGVVSARHCKLYTFFTPYFKTSLYLPIFSNPSFPRKALYKLCVLIMPCNHKTFLSAHLYYVCRPLGFKHVHIQTELHYSGTASLTLYGTVIIIIFQLKHFPNAIRSRTCT